MRLRRNAWIELDLEVFGRTLSEMKASLGATTEIIQVVKANAYNHGMDRVALKARDCGVKWFLIARIDEAVQLRALLPEAGILLLGSVWPADLEDIRAHRIIPVLMSEVQAEELAAAARREGVRLPCHIKVDTGMGRFGFAWEDASSRIVRLQEAGGLDVQGVCMHFASAHDPRTGFAALQLSRFKAVVEDCRAQGMATLFRHAANSAAYLLNPEADFDGVRLGIGTYGYAEPRAPFRVKGKPFLQWKTRILQVKQVPAGFPVSYSSTYVTPEATTLATIDVGYADGFPRLMSNTGYVLIGGRRVKVAGCVTMNFTMVDLGPQGRAAPGDEVVLIGTQGKESIWADEVGRWCQTIPYEILTNIRCGMASHD